jgi:hypothetical protein
MRKALKPLLSLVVLAVFSGVGFLNFYRINFESLTGPSRLVRYYLAVLAFAIAGSLIAKGAFRSVPLFRILLAAAVLAFMAFNYDAIKVRVGSEPAILPILVWLGVTILAGFAVGKFSGRAAFLPTMAIVGLAYVVPAAMSLIHGQSRHLRAVNSAALSLTSNNARNVYWIVLDGYPRADVLRQFFDFDNDAFLKGLRDLDFVVYDRALASFPETIFSISSTLSLGFLQDGGGSPVTILPTADLYPMVRGQNVVVNTLRSMGYRYVHFENGYDNLTKCPLEGAVCIKGNDEAGAQFDEFNLALLSKTPLMDVIALGSAGLVGDQTPFVSGAVRDLTDKLAMVQAVGGPFFLYGHILAPHPPMRFRRDCSPRLATPDLLDWNADEKPAFLDQLVCVNGEATDLVGDIVRSDPQAIIVLQSDHGTAFRGQFKKPFDAWDELDVKERFGALNAIRMPVPCASYAEGSVDLVDTFSRVLGCISGSRLPDRASRQFVVSHADMTQVHEYRADSE